VTDAIESTVGQSAPQVRAAHILLPSQDEAEAARERVTTGGEDFGQVARQLSLDPATTGNGGELGWFTREEVPPAVADAAFALEPGQISEPVQSPYGWHLVKVEEREPDRPLTNAQITRVQQDAVDRWAEQEKTALNVTSVLTPTPTPSAAQFAPPVGAPPPPTPTPLPATPGATPVGVFGSGPPAG
jgi:peptidyl-prolyl cis-trans isomerase C